ncbi:methionine ABC transporter ATP-binding protein [Camelimonas abortus]|uniref:Methionine ABC transporter ATP-binding protein n=1 Tax=Camelimonas abortus TaxID=1017184 RepID=A0ABV7LE95_9HYPH
MNMLSPAGLANHSPPAPDPADALVRFESVRKVYPPRPGGEAFTALDHVDLTVPRGSVLGVIGRSGAGKSTLIRLVNGLEKATSGRVLVDGVDVTPMGEAELRRLRRSIGMVFQHFNLLSSRTVYDNVALPLEIAGASRAEIRKRVEPLLELVGLADRRDRYPAELSGGQKQRVGIARALATQPKALLSDEATSALDPETTQSILDLLGSINAELGLTILLITHEMSVVARIARQVAVLDGGRIVEQGDVYDVFTRPQHPTTRSFLGEASGRTLPGWLAKRLHPQPRPGDQAVVRVIFRGPIATDALVSGLVRSHGLDVNILSGAVDEVAGRPFGALVLGVPGGPQALRRAVDWFTGYGLDVEVLGHVS